ncbi:hypothetical protein [Rosistilla oblonga]|uniref:Secreted protein n=1 Tax=Rosistilla oblonga TaxID=2527990 RepID=A0A518IQL2_9BACT|nr:hypothetical protein [Rosistilla oblonga]QDV55382.1 hypothetical protein Mal33_13530 [Rosistilla oblonga]
MVKRILERLCFVALASIGSVSCAEESIAFCMPEWKEMHFDDGAKAQLHLAAVQKLGCEAKIDNHGSHIDVVYRSPKWKSLEVADDKLAHQWESWLKKAGFETLHGHAADHGGDDHAGHEGHDHSYTAGQIEEVNYRVSEWKTMHIETKEQITELTAMLKGLGCELKISQHSGHADLSFRCQQWKHIEVGSHQVATTWEQWLVKMGFEVKHDH